MKQDKNELTQEELEKVAGGFTQLSDGLVAPKIYEGDKSGPPSAEISLIEGERATASSGGQCGNPDNEQEGGRR